MENKTVKLLFYCTQAKPYLLGSYGRESVEEYKDYWSYYTSNTLKCDYEKILNGKIVAEAECELVEKLVWDCPDMSEFDAYFYYLDKEYWKLGLQANDKLLEDIFKFQEKACLDDMQLDDYGKGKDLFGIHLENIKPFEEPKKLSDYHVKKKCNSCYISGYEATGCSYGDCIVPAVINKAAQNMMYCYDKDGKLYVLISVQSLYMCDIMNGLKTIEVRKQILNIFKELMSNEKNKN